MTGRPAFRIAAAQYDPTYLTSWDAYRTKIEGWFARAVAGGAEFLLFPEYFSMELASLFGPAVCRSLTRQLDALQDLVAAFCALYALDRHETEDRRALGSFPLFVAAMALTVREDVLLARIVSGPAMVSRA